LFSWLVVVVVVIARESERLDRLSSFLLWFSVLGFCGSGFVTFGSSV